MDLARSNIVIVLFVLPVLIVGGTILQIYLSKRESKWPGLILPAISLCVSLLPILSVAVLDGMSGGKIFSMIATMFLLGNIPTIVHLGIYFACRDKRKKRAQLDKMNIQDLD